MKEITLNLAGCTYRVEYSDDFSYLFIYLKGNKHTFRSISLGCGQTLDRDAIINTIKRKIKNN